MSYSEIRKMVHTLASSKAAQPGLNQKELLGIDVVHPNKSVMKMFNDMISSSMHMIAVKAKESRHLADLRDTLLPKLISGQIKV